MGRTLEVARVVFANQLKSLWRSHGPRGLRRSPSLLVVVAQHALALMIVLNYAFVVRGGSAVWLGSTRACVHPRADR